MKVNEEFTVARPAATLWEFFEQVDRVARCVPGVDQVAVTDADNSRVQITQTVGPMTATFDLKMRITARDPGRSIAFTAVGRSVKGAAGNVRATNTVQLEAAGDEATLVRLESDVALGGMVGSLGQKVVAKHAAKLTQEFAAALQRELSGEGPPGAEPAESAAVSEEFAGVSGKSAGVSGKSAGVSGGLSGAGAGRAGVSAETPAAPTAARPWRRRLARAVVIGVVVAAAITAVRRRLSR
jgi:uncharacterized protein